MSSNNTERNEEIVKKRLDNHKKWSFGELGKFYNLHKTTVENVFKRDLKKYATQKQIDRYYKMMQS